MKIGRTSSALVGSSKVSQVAGLRLTQPRGGRREKQPWRWRTAFWRFGWVVCWVVGKVVTVTEVFVKRMNGVGRLLDLDRRKECVEFDEDRDKLHDIGEEPMEVYIHGHNIEGKLQRVTALPCFPIDNLSHSDNQGHALTNTFGKETRTTIHDPTVRQAEVPHPRAFVGARSSPRSVGLVARNRSLIIIEERTHRVDECDLWAPLMAVQLSSRALSVDHPSSNLMCVLKRKLPGFTSALWSLNVFESLLAGLIEFKCAHLRLTRASWH